MNVRLLVCRERSIVRGDEDRIMIRPSSRPEARSLLGCQTVNELGAPVASSISKDGIRRWPCSLSAVSTCRRTAWMWWCCLRGWFFSVSNDTAGWAELVARLRPLTVSAIGLEPSGGYERGIIRALLAAGLSVRRINPNKLRQFARARGVLAKNDRLDARLIAEYVAIMPTRVVQRDAAVERLAEIVTMRRQLCDEHVAAENQAAHLEDAMLRRLSKRRQTRLEADIRLLDKRLAEMVAANVALAQR